MLAALLAASSVAGSTFPPPTPEPSSSKDMVMTTASSYPVRFASTRRDSALPVVTTATGKVAWSKEMGKATHADWPPTVLIWGQRVLVASAPDMVMFDAQGQALWTRPKQIGTPLAVAQGNLYFKARSSFLEALDASDQTVLREAPFPGAMSSAVTVDLFWPQEHDFIAVLTEPGDGEVSDGDEPDAPLDPPHTLVLRNRYPTTYGDWQIALPGLQKLAPLLVPERQVVALMFDALVRVDATNATEISRFKVPLATLAEWSVDTDEVYCFTGYVGPAPGDSKVLLALSAAGEELWRWVDPEGTDTWAVRQPPIRAKGGRVYALTQGRVLAVEQGKLVWQYDTRSDSLQHGAKVDSGSFEIKDGRLLATGSLRHGSVLGDGSLLVTGGKTLHHLSADGRKLFSVSVDSDILSPPAVDEHGHIYVATATHLVRID
ncbi:MAG: PQQ-binding-like beta-propeller repeat protein [Rubrivivax sp.]|nr:PQQ-binding-like beta-propeller repeat protein [Rubrivivax sp.]